MAKEKTTTPETQSQDKPVRSDQLPALPDASQLLPVASPQTFSLTPRNLAEAMKFAEMICASDLVPKDYKGKPGNALIAIQMGQEVGLKPMQALQNIASINGRPCIWGDALPALVYASGKLEWIKETFDKATLAATCQVKRKGMPPSQVYTFNKEMAQKANLWGKQGPWSNYKERMLQMRPRAYAFRDHFSDVLKGLSIAEEMMDIEPIVDETPLAPPEAIPDEVVDAEVVEEESTPQAHEEAEEPTPPASSVEVPPEATKTDDNAVISREQVTRLWTIVTDKLIAQDTAKKLIALYGFTSSKDITRHKYDAIVSTIEGGIEVVQQAIDESG